MGVHNNMMKKVFGVKWGRGDGRGWERGFGREYIPCFEVFRKIFKRKVPPLGYFFFFFLRRSIRLMSEPSSKNKLVSAVQGNAGPNGIILVSCTMNGCSTVHRKSRTRSEAESCRVTQGKRMRSTCCNLPSVVRRLIEPIVHKARNSKLKATR